MAKRYSNRFIKLPSTKFGSAALLIAGLVLLIAVLEITNTTHIFHKAPSPPVIPITATNPSPNGAVANNTTQPAPKQPTTSKNNTSAGSNSGSATINLPLYAPYGDFVSNHTPGQNGSPTQESSVCTTTPGAKCYIKFSGPNGASSRLPAQITGADGSTRWTWNANTLSTGNWTVTAVASLNGQTKSTADPTLLSIK